jgi:hypothetical protein
VGVFTQSTIFAQNVLMQAFWYTIGSAADLKFTTGQYYNGTDGADVTTLLSCSRASIGYAQTAAGTLTQFASNTLRITDLGLLVEDARTNLARSSQDMSNATYWSYNNLTTTANAATAPDGTTTATKIIQTAGGGAQQHETYTFLGVGTAASYTWSVYLKAAELNFGFLKANVNNIASVVTLVVDLTTGASNVNNSGPAAGVSTSVTALANGWYRLTITADNVDSANNFLACGPLTTFTPTYFAGNPIDTSTGTNGIYAWGAQQELGAFASSYIPTTTAAATRAADAINCASTLDTVLSTLPTSVVMDVRTLALPPVSDPRFLNSSSNADSMLNISSILDTRVGAYVQTGDHSLQVDLGNSLTFTGGVKVGGSMNSSGRSVVGGGGTVATDAFFSVMASPVQIGRLPYMYGYIRRLTAWNSRLADATLQGLTAP